MEVEVVYEHTCGIEDRLCSVSNVSSQNEIF
jgi:hypothetical protein